LHALSAGRLLPPPPALHPSTPPSLRISIYKGDVVLKNLQLKPEALDGLDLPVTVRAGLLGSLTLKVPWSSLGTVPVEVKIDRLYLLASPKSEEERGKGVKGEVGGAPRQRGAGRLPGQAVLPAAPASQPLPHCCCRFQRTPAGLRILSHSLSSRSVACRRMTSSRRFKRPRRRGWRRRRRAGWPRWRRWRTSRTK
jgi:vacuolar protein sorting-associated protein 13A/C